MTTLTDKNKEGGAVSPSHQLWPINEKMEIKAAEMVRAELFSSPCLLLLWRWYREKPTASSPLWWNNHILFPHAGEHYSPTLPSTMGQVRRARRNTSAATSAAATGLLGDTVYSVLPVALWRSLQEKLDFSCSQTRALGTVSTMPP